SVQLDLRARHPTEQAGQARALPLLSRPYVEHDSAPGRRVPCRGGGLGSLRQPGVARVAVRTRQRAVAMPALSVDPATGALVNAGTRLFPLGLSNGPPPGKLAPSGREGLAEVAASGINMLRTGAATWGAEETPGLIEREKQIYAQAAAAG